jgi:uncharacterized protein
MSCFRKSLGVAALRLIALTWAFAGTVLLAFADGPYPVVVQRNVEARMRDGVVLRADVYRPDRDGKFPVLLERTPYNKNGDGGSFGRAAAARGYVVIIQDVRGRYTSEGEWYTFKHESDDGYETVEWAAALPYSDGKVGMFGGSYVGATQMLAAIAHPPHLAGIFPVVTASNYHDGWTYQGGAFEQWFNQSWTSGLAQDTLNRKVEGATNALEGIERLPLTSYPLFNFDAAQATSLESLTPYFLDWLRHPSYDDYWKRWSIEEHYADIQVPAYVVAAWYDIFQGGSLRNYLGITTHGGSEAARTKSRLLIMIGGHAGGGPKIGEVDFGKQSVVDDDQVMLNWYDMLFKGEDNELAHEKPVKLFIMGRNTWREESAWPPSDAHLTAYYLHSAGDANSLDGDGTLSTSASGPDAADHFTYDPANPAPTVGGPLCCDSGHLAPGAFDQRKVESRPDVLVYTTPAFDRDYEVTGPVTLDLYASSSAVDTDFTAKLVDVAPDGFARNLTEGIVRARYRDSQERPKPLQPGKIYEFHVDLWATGNVFLAGHKMHLEVSSSNFPRFDRNLNTGQAAGESASYVKSDNTVYHDQAHPSTLTVDVVEH